MMQMLIPVQDAVLLALVLASMCAIVWGDLSMYLRSGRDRSSAPRHGSASPTVPRSSPPGGSPSRASRRPETPLVADLLLVDDSAVARAKLRKLFVRNGYSVQLASDGVEALALLRAGRYSMMITDLEMPNMGGIELIRECRRQPFAAGMPVIAVSAHENLRAKFNECRDICGVHRKPWVDDILLSHVATQIGPRRAAVAQVGERELDTA